MRRILVASVLLSPLFFTAAAVASQPVADDAASTPVSTGVKPVSYTHLSSAARASFEDVPVRDERTEREAEG